MANSFPSMLFLLLFSAGCALLQAEQEVEKVPEKAAPIQVSEKPPVDSKSADTVESAKFKSNNDDVIEPRRLETESLSQDDIRRIQAKLKASGFNPGPIDGILGPKTKSALLQLQSSCSALLDVTDLSKVEYSRVKPGTELIVLSEPPRETFGKEELRRLQTHLKQSGFDPGPLDGIFGPKTKAAMLRARSGCSLAKQFPVIGLDLSIEASRSTPTFILTGQTHTAGSDASPPTDSFDRGDNGLSLVGDKSAGVDKIRRVQVQLKEAGFDPGPIDGILGPRTRSALRGYRASNGFTDTARRLSGVGARMEY